MKTLISLLLFTVVTTSSTIGQATSIFAKGEVSTVNNHTGKVWLRELNVADSIIDCNIATATFEPGAKLDWHVHPAGQILMIIDGKGYYQERDKPIQLVQKGDVIKCVPGVPHWHGASPDSSFTYIAVSTESKRNKTVWLQRVTEVEYKSARN